MVLHIILADILLIARIFPHPFGARKNTTQLAKYPRVLYVKPSNKMYVLPVPERLVTLIQTSLTLFYHGLVRLHWGLSPKIWEKKPFFPVSFYEGRPF